MAKAHAPLHAFNRGEVSKLALCRVDNERLRLASEVQVNWSPYTLGAMMLRPGLGYLFSTRSDAACNAIPFVFGASDTAILELTDSHLQAIVSDAKVTRASVATTVTNGDFNSNVGWTLAATDGCTADINSTVAGSLWLYATARGGVVSCLRSVSVAAPDQNVAHALRIAVGRGPVIFMCGSTSGGAEYIGRTLLDTGTHSLAFTPTGGTFYVKFESLDRRAKIVDSITVDSAGTLDLPTPWIAADLSKLRWHQSGDVVFVACKGYQQRKIERRANNSWSVVTYQSDDGPFSFVDTAGVTLTPSVYEGTGTLTASRAMFSSTSVGQLFRIFSAGQTKQALLGALSAASEPIRIAGVGTTDRGFSFVVAGTFVGTLALQRSVEGPTTGFKATGVTVAAVGTTAIDDSATYNNVVVWYRLVFTAYTSGSATTSFTNTTTTIPTHAGPVTTTSDAAVTSGTAGICRVAAYTSPTAVDIEVLAPFSSISASADWMPGDWNATDGYPSEVRFFEGRLYWFRGDRRWGSVSDAYYSFDFDSIGDSATINRTFGAGPASKINFALDLTELVIGREMSVDPVRSSAQGEPLTPTNSSAKSCATKGAAELPALKVGTRGVYVEKSGARVYALLYQVEAGDYVGHDLTRLNLDIGAQGFVSLAVREQPETALHFVRGDGQDAILLYEPGDEIACWWRTMTLGVIERVVTLPGSQEDSLYYVVKRTINGSTKRFWEKQAKRSECAGGATCKLADAFVLISQASSVTIGGLSHLEGESVVVWANGKDLGAYTVSGGAIVVSEAVTAATVGLGGVSFSYDSTTAAASVTAAAKYNGYPAEVFANSAQGGELRYVGPVTVAAGVVTLPNGKAAKKIIAYLGFYGVHRSAKLAYGAEHGTAISQRQKIEKIGLILHNTHYQGLTYGSEPDNLNPLPLTYDGQTIAANTVLDENEPPMDGISSGWSTDSRLHLLAQAPRPCTVAGAVIAVNTSESP